MCEILNITIRNANKGQLLKPEERGYRWTGMYPRATHQGTLSSKTKKFCKRLMR